MYKKALNIIYWVLVENGVERSHRLETDIGLKSTPISVDDRRNLPDLYRELFEADGEDFIVSLVDSYMQKLSEAAITNADDIIRTLDLLQGIIMTARAPYEIPVNRGLYAFAQKYDRLDDEGVRLALFKEANEKKRKL